MQVFILVLSSRNLCSKFFSAANVSCRIFHKFSVLCVSSAVCTLFRSLVLQGVARFRFLRSACADSRHCEYRHRAKALLWQSLADLQAPCMLNLFASFHSEICLPFSLPEFDTCCKQCVLRQFGSVRKRTKLPHVQFWNFVWNFLRWTGRGCEQITLWPYALNLAVAWGDLDEVCNHEQLSPSDVGALPKWGGGGQGGLCLGVRYFNLLFASSFVHQRKY